MRLFGRDLRFQLSTQTEKASTCLQGGQRVIMFINLLLFVGLNNRRHENYVSDLAYGREHSNYIIRPDMSLGVSVQLDGREEGKFHLRLLMSLCVRE